MNLIFLDRLLGNSGANRLYLLGWGRGRGPNINDIPCIFPVIRELTETLSLRTASTATT